MKVYEINLIGMILRILTALLADSDVTVAARNLKSDSEGPGSSPTHVAVYS